MLVAKNIAIKSDFTYYSSIKASIFQDSKQDCCDPTYEPKTMNIFYDETEEHAEPIAPPIATKGKHVASKAPKKSAPKV